MATSAFAMASALATFSAACAFVYASTLGCLAAAMAYSLWAFATPKVKTVKVITPDRNVNNWFNAFIVLFTLSFIQMYLQYTMSKSLGKLASSYFIKR